MRRKTTMSLSLDVLLCLCLSLGANCLHATSVYFYTLLSKPFLQDQVQLSIPRVFTCPFLCSVLHFIYAVSTDNRIFYQRPPSQILHLSAPRSRGLIHPKPDLTCFPLDLSQLIPYLWTSTVSVLGDKDIFSSLELLAHEWIIIQFHGKTQTAFFVSSTKLIFYLFSVEQI